jgi:hypothetical protein
MPSVAFYGTTQMPLTRSEIRLARGICVSCPVQRSCLIESLREKERYGVWGGLDEKTRRRLIRTHSGDWKAIIDVIDRASQEAQTA